MSAERDDKQRAIDALTSRFDITAANATSLVETIPQSEHAELAAQINRQANAFESMVSSLIDKLMLSTVEAIAQTQQIIKSGKNTLPGVGHIAVINQVQFNLEYINLGLSVAAIKRLDAGRANQRDELLSDAVFDAELIKQEQLKPKPIPKTPAEEMQGVWDYNFKLLIDELGINAEESSRRMSNIPVSEHNSITHHLKGHTGFYVRFTTYVERIMAVTSYTYEELTQTFWQIAKEGKHAKSASIDISPFLSLNELDTVYRFKEWHFQLLSQKTCDKFHQNYPRAYQRLNVAIACQSSFVPYAPPQENPGFMPAQRFVPGLKSKINPQGSTKIEAGTVLTVFAAAGSFVVTLCLLARVLCPRRFGLFGKNFGKPHYVKKTGVSSQQELSLHHRV